MAWSSPRLVRYLQEHYQAIAVHLTRHGLRANTKGNSESPAMAQKYLASKVGEHLEDDSGALRKLANQTGTADLQVKAFRLYEVFRPAVAAGTVGRGAKGTLSL